MKRASMLWSMPLLAKKSEVVYSGVSVTIPAPTNLVSLLKTLTPSSGTLAPFFDTVNNKMVVFNEEQNLVLQAVDCRDLAQLIRQQVNAANIFRFCS
ncbi:tail needle knob protein [Escherichia coli]